MKIIPAFILFIFIRLSAPAQVVVSVDKINAVYIGLDNPISVAVPNVRSEDLIVSTIGGTITGERGNYILRPSDNEQSKEMVVNVSYYKAEKLIAAGQKTFKIKRFPDPVLLFSNLEEGDYIKANLIGRKIIHAESWVNMEHTWHSPDVGKVTVLNFTIDLNSCSQTFTHFNNGMQMDSTSLALVQKANTGDRITISTDEYYGPVGKGKNKLVARYYIIDKKE